MPFLPVMGTRMCIQQMLLQSMGGAVFTLAPSCANLLFTPG